MQNNRRIGIYFFFNGCKRAALAATVYGFCRCNESSILLYQITFDSNDYKYTLILGAIMLYNVLCIGRFGERSAKGGVRSIKIIYQEVLSSVIHVTRFLWLIGVTRYDKNHERLISFWIKEVRENCYSNYLYADSRYLRLISPEFRLRYTIIPRIVITHRKWS